MDKSEDMPASKEEDVIANIKDEVRQTISLNLEMTIHYL